VSAQPALYCKFDLPCCHREKGVILAHSDIGTRMNPGTTLAYEYFSGQHCLSAKPLYA
jgi:hypothetical protein